VTCNVDDFPGETLSALRLEAVHPDDFLFDQLDLSPPTILQVIQEQAACTRQPHLPAHCLVLTQWTAHLDRLATEQINLKLP
jgi:hypothetical protein